jgi:ribonuclease PH
MTMAHKIERSFAGRQLMLETGRMAKQAAGSVLIRHGDTMVLAAVTVSDRQSHLPFFPLTVEYREKTYAAGKFPGGFIKREGRPSDEEILACRLTDRSVRPLFPEGFKNEVQVFLYVVSADQENDADVLALTAASAALAVSNVPWNGPIAGVRVGRVNGELVLNPTFAQLEESDLDLVVAGTADSLMMVEGGALEVGEEDLLAALAFAQQGIAELVAMQRELVSRGGRDKMAWTPDVPPAEVAERVRGVVGDRMRQALNHPDKAERAQALAAVRAAVIDELNVELAEQLRALLAVLDEIEYETMRAQVLDKGERVDGRKPGDIRPINITTGRASPRVRTARRCSPAARPRPWWPSRSAACATSSGSTRSTRREETSKSFMLHYNFPPFSVGEAKPFRGTEPPRDRPRHAGRAGSPAVAARVRRLPVHHPGRLRHPRVERLELDGLGVRRVAGPDARGCADARSLRRRGDGADQGRRRRRRADRHPRRRGLPRRHGLQGGRDARRHHLDPDGHQDRGLEISTMRDALRAGAQGPPAHPRRDERDPVRGRQDVRVGAADRVDQDQHREDRRPDRAEGQDDPRHPGGHRRRHQRRGRRHRDDLGRGSARGQTARDRDGRGDHRRAGDRPHLRGRR